jgi:sugar/nucleoside kinase (ribokinase family)
VDRHRDEILALLRQVDLVFANESEVSSLYREPHAGLATRELGLSVRTSAVTLGANGCYVTSDGLATHVPASPATVVDTTGAGDAFAAGFLVGYASGQSPDACAWLGSRAAAEAVSRWGARLPRGSLEAVAAREPRT